MSKTATLAVPSNVASKLAFGTQPSNTTGGVTISPAVTVNILDVNGNPTTSTASVTLAIGTNPGGGTLSGTATVAAVSGVATFSNLSIDRAGTGYTLTAASTGLTGATSNAFNVTVGPPSRLGFSVQPSNTAAGAYFNPSIRVQIQDAGGNVTTSTASVTIAIGTNPGGGTLSGVVTKNAIFGTATFDVWIDKVGTGYTLTAASSGLTGGTSVLFNITPGAASKLAFGAQPSNATGGSPIAPAVTVLIQDANGNQTASTAWVVVAIGTNPGGDTLSGTMGVTAVAGVATFGNLSIDKVGTGYTLTAASLGLTGATSNAFNVTVGAAAKLAFGTQPMSVAPATSITPAVTVRILDAGGNLTTSTASVTVAIGSNPGGGTLSGTKTKAAVAGAATFSNLSINLAGNGYTLTAASASLTGATSTPFNVGGATKIRVETANDGTGVVVPAQTLAPGAALTMYAISRDTSNAFVANEVVDNWSLAAATGGVAAGDLVPLASMKEFALPAPSSYPNGIATGSDGNVWFTENGTNKVGRITTPGVITEFAIPTASSSVLDIAAGPDGNLWFIENAANKIGRITTAGVITEFVVPTANSYLSGITAGPDGSVWFTEQTGNKVCRITIAGTITEFPIPTAGGGPFGIAPGPDGNLWFTEGSANKIGRITTTGTITEFAVPTAGGYPYTIAAGADGNVWFNEYNGNKIARITTAGVITEFAIPTASSGVHDIAVGSDGNLWFTESQANQLGRITTAGVIAEFAVPTFNSGATAIALGPDGKIWFTESGGNKIARFESKGATFTGHAIGTAAVHAIRTSLAWTDSGTLTVAAGPPTKLAFGTQPSNTAAGSAITPAVTIQIQDANGNLTASTASVTVAIGTNPGAGTLSGTATVAAVNGVATFSTLSINTPGTGYTLTAASLGLAGATSSAFNIVPGAASRLVFGTQPSSVPVGIAISPAVTVQILDAGGNLTTSAASVTVAIGTNPAGGVLSGTKTLNAVAGVATFSNLSIDKAGTGYTFTAASTGLTGATSTQFDIGAATKILVETKSDGTGVVVPSQSIAAGSSLNVYAIGRDANNAFVANVTPASWSLISITGSVVAADLVSAGAVAEFQVGTTQPAGIAAGPDGNLWFAELSGNKIGRITPAGVITEFLVPSSSSTPYAIAAGPDGNLWFTEQAGRIGRITSAGVVTEFLIPSLASSYAIVAGPDGNLWFTEYTANKIARITTAGVVTEFTVPTSSSQPYGIATGSDGALWFTESAAGKIGRITTAGGFTEFPIPTASSQPRFIASGLDGNLWFTEYGGNKIGRITTAGVITEFAIPTISSQPSGIASGPDGNLWFTEQGGNKIGKITTAGVISEIGASGSPMSIVTGADQNLWFTENGASRIGRVGTATATANGKATFTGHKSGTAIIHAAKYGMTSTDSGVLTVPAGAANKLAFGVQPVGAVAGAAFAPALTVQILDANGNVISSTASITVAIGANPGGGTLSGTQTKAAVAGIATFSDLSINKIGRGYTLTATSAGLTAVTSVAFEIRPGTATKLIVETAADGTGAAVSGQSVAIGSTLTAWAISRDANNNFVATVVPDSWSLTGKTGGVVDGDLVPGAGFAEFSLNHAPVAITAGLDGNVWFTEFEPQYIYVSWINPAGAIGESLEEFCNGVACPWPQGIVRASDGSVWYSAGLSVTKTHNVYHFGTLNPYGIASGSDGNLWFAQYKNDAGGHGDAIGRMTLAGVRTDFPVPTAGSGPLAIVGGPDNNIWFTEYVRGQIGKITPGGIITEFPINGSCQPSDIAPAPDGNLWFTERAANKIGRLTTTGTLTEFTLGYLGGFGTPHGIVAGSDGNLWFTKEAGSKIGRITPAGIATDFPLPASTILSGITAGTDGNLWFTEQGPPHKIGRLSPAIGSATLTGHQTGTSIIHAVKAGLTSTDSGTITVAAAAATLILNPSTVSGVSPSTGTITLSAPAPVGGRLVNLSSSNTTLATVPASVTVAAGTTTKTFTVTPRQVFTTSYVTIQAVVSSVSYTAKLTLATAPLLASLTLPSLTVTGNTGSATGTVTMATAVPNSVTVNLASSWPTVVIPPTVTVPANASSVTFPISIPDLTGFTNAIITATSGATSKQAMLTVIVPHITAPVADPGSYTYPASAPVVFNSWAQTINSQVLDYRWVPYDPANAGGFVVVPPGQTRVTLTPLTPQMRLVVTVAGSPQPSVMDAADACSGVMPGSCAWRSISLVPNRSCPAPSPTQLFPTVTGLTDFVSGSPPSISSTLFQASDRYSWLLEVESPPGSSQYTSAAATQNAGPLNDGFDSTNRVWTPKLAGNVQLGPGHYRLQSLVARPSGSCYSQNGWSPLYAFNVTSTGAKVLGLAPGVALPGEPNLVLYASGADATTSVALSGPVYSLFDTTFSSPLCDLSTGTCQMTVLPASFGSGGTLTFALPTISTGYYFAQSRSSAGVKSFNGDWLRVDQSAKTNPVVPPAQHNLAYRILPGQTVTGTFAAGGDTTGTTADYNTFYFFGTAGSVLNASVARVDTSLPWEDPASLDPQLEIVAPDGLVYDNLRRVDDQPGVDYNATLTGAVLPQTGLYFIRPETLKGSGDYRLTLSFSSVAAAPAASRAIPFAGNFNTVPVNNSVMPVAFVLDPRGYTVSGADVTWAVVPGADDTGTVQFQTPAAVLSAWDGSTSVTVQLTAQGKVQLAPSLTNPILAQGILAKPEGAEAGPVPRYAPVVSLPITPTGIDEEGVLYFVEGVREELPLWRPAPPRRERDAAPAPEAGWSRQAGGAMLSGFDGASAAGAGSGAATTAAPEPLQVHGIDAVETITSCATALFVQAGVNAAALQPPLTITLTDETPSTGGTLPNGVVDSAGIHGHRIVKTIRMKLDIKDATGQAPAYPVLVHLTLSGPAHGTLILDPDGNRIQCSQASFLWHERNAQNQIIALNEEFEYTLGTYAPYVGAVPDPLNLNQLKPVWGTGEVLGMTVATVNSGGVTTQLTQTFKVRPEPGRPDHLSVSVPPPPQGTPEVIWTYWSDQWLDPPNFTGRVAANYQAYYLLDQYDNLTFGYTNTVPAPTSSMPSVSFQFFDETAGSRDGVTVDPVSFGYKVSWQMSPTPPQGNAATTFSVTYPTDPEWAGGVVSKAVTFTFQRGTFQFIEGVAGWDCFWLPNGAPCISDPTAPWSVSPGATGDGLPKATTGTAPLDAGRQVFIIGKSASPPVYLPPLNPPWVEVADNPAFKLSLVDSKGKVVPDAIFKVHLCPRYDHFIPGGQGGTPRPCTTTPLQSTNGGIDSVRVNANGAGAPDSQGYLGVEVVQAPSYPGDYYMLFEVLEGKPYRVRSFMGRTWDLSTAGESKGAFWLLTVTGADFLDESFRHANPYVVSQPTTAYLRYYSTTPLSPGTQVQIRSAPESDTSITLGTIVLSLPRIGGANTYITEGFTLIPPPVGPAPTGIKPITEIQTLSLPVAAPATRLYATILGVPIGEARALTGEVPILTEWRYNGDGKTGATWLTLSSNREVFLQDDLRLTVQLPGTWPVPLSYLWTLKIDGKPYVPTGVDLTKPSILLAQTDRAGKLDAEVKLTYSSQTRIGKTSRDIWLETSATAIVTWINGGAIDLIGLYPNTPFTNCAVFFADGLAAYLSPTNSFTKPGDPAFPADFNAASLKYGAIAEPPPSFDTEAELLQFIHENKPAYKEGQGVEFQARVLNGRIPINAGGALSQGRELVKAADVGSTEIKLPPCISFLNLPLDGALEPTRNRKSFEIFTGGSVGAFFTENKGRIGPSGQRIFNVMNCNGADCTPYIWTKSVFTVDSPFPRTDWIAWRTSFPTTRLYYSAKATDGGRKFPIALIFENPQVANPNTFLQNPDPD